MSLTQDEYKSPLCSRYASKAMRTLFSNDKKFQTWRRLWIALAEAECSLGLPITEEQIAELHSHAEDINYDAADAHERRVKHDVMAHIHAYGDLCPLAKGIIHMGATSSFVGDNADIILMREGLEIIKSRVLSVIHALSVFAEKYATLPTVGYTHFQPAQPVTVGKRAILWINDLVMDYEELSSLISRLPFFGCKGATGTAASFLSLFEGDHEKVKWLEKNIAEKMGFKKIISASGQTYSRKWDSQILNVLSGIAQSAAKFSNDIRLLAHEKEIEEPFARDQVGSSAMPHKRNPMKSERIASLARYVMTAAQNAPLTMAGQWLERTLDDSANRRIALPESFLATDAILLLYKDIASGMVVYPKVILKNLLKETSFLAAERVMMQAVKAGGDRQTLHEALRKHIRVAAERLQEGAEDNDLLKRLAGDPLFHMDSTEISDLLSAEAFIGRAANQTKEYLEETVKPLLAAESFTDDGEKPEV